MLPSLRREMGEAPLTSQPKEMTEMDEMYGILDPEWDEITEEEQQEYEALAEEQE